MDNSGLISKIKVKMQAPGFQRYFRNTGWLFVGKIGGMVISILTGVLVARYLGPANYGLLSYVYSFVGMFAFLASLGIDTILTRELVLQPEKANALLGTSALLKVAGGVLVFTISVVSAFIVPSDGFTRLLIVLYAFSFILQASNVLDTFFHAKVLAKNVVISQLGVAVCISLLKLFLILNRATIIYFVLLVLVEGVLTALAYVFVYWKFKGNIAAWYFEKRIAVKMLKDSWPLIFSTAFYLVYLSIDKVILKHMMNNTAVGVYDIAVRISEVWYFIPGTICASLYPAIVNAKKTSEDLYELRMQRLYRLMVWLAIGVAFPVMVIAPFVIQVVFGPAYAGAIGPLKIYIWAGVAFFLITAVNQYLLTENYTKLNLGINVVGSISNVILNIALIPRYGIRGAAIATVISYSVVPLSLFFFKRTRRHGVMILKAFVPKFE